MSFEIKYVDIHEPILYNFSRHCGRYSWEISTEEYRQNVNNELKHFNAYRDFEKNYITFQTEAHYQWFLMRWV